MSTHSLPTLCWSAVCPAYLRAASGSRSAIVFEPVPDGAVAASIVTPPQKSCGVPRRSLNGVRHLDEAALDAKALCDELADAADAERLAGVVAGGDEVEAGLAGVRHRVLGGLAG